MRKTSISLLSVPALLCALLVSGCADWEAHMQSKLPEPQPMYQGKEIKVVGVRSVADVPFADGQTSLSPAETSKLHAFLDAINPQSDYVVMVEQPTRKAGRVEMQRGKSVAAAVKKLGYQVADYPVTDVQPGSIRVAVDHLSALGPKCPDWKIHPYAEYGAQQMPNTGCSDRTNLAAMIVNPADLVDGQVPATASGHQVTYGEIRVRHDQIRPLEDATASFDTGG